MTWRHPLLWLALGFLLYPSGRWLLAKVVNRLWPRRAGDDGEYV